MMPAHIYRSDWLECGHSTPWQAEQASDGDSAARPIARRTWIDEATALDWAIEAEQNGLESSLYALPVVELRATAVSYVGLHSPTHAPFACARLSDDLEALLRDLPATPTYLYAKVCRDEPLHEGLLRHGFAIVEHRRVFTSAVQDISGGAFDHAAVRGLSFSPLSHAAPAHHASIRSQILAICEESFQSGASRHFQDPWLSGRQPGVGYIVAAMHRNFLRIASEHILLAVDDENGTVCGFCVIGRKGGLDAEVYTQLLSATRPAYRRRGVYLGLSRLAAATLPPAARIMNVTHHDNHAMQGAYRKSRRALLGDTVVLRRVVDHP